MPFHKTLDEFDFTFQPSVNERQFRDLATMRFVAHAENLLLLGPPGVGKTHLAVALGMCAVLQGMSVLFYSLPDLIQQLAHDAKADRLPQRLQTLARPQCEEIRIAGLGRSRAQLSRDAILRRKCELRGTVRVHFAHESVGDPACGLAGEFLGDGSDVLARCEQSILVRLLRARLGTGDEGRAELCSLRAKREHCGYARAIHDPPGGNHRDLHGAHDQAGECQRAGKRFVGIAKVGAAMPAGFAPLRDDEVEPELFKPLRLGDAGRARTNGYAL